MATQKGEATEEIMRLLGSDGFVVLRAETGRQVVDALSGWPAGGGARAALLIIGSTLYRDVSSQIAASLRTRRGPVPIVIQLDDTSSRVPIVRRAAITTVNETVAPDELVATATSMLSNGLLDALCQTDQRAWNRASAPREADGREAGDP